MTKAKTAWLLLGILCLASYAAAQDTAWEKYMKVGMDAHQRGQCAEAKKQFAAARKEAENLSAQDPRLGISLLGLGKVYMAQANYTQAQPLYQRAMSILEKALGPEHPAVATCLNQLAALYHAQGQYAKAEPLFRRAVAIHEKALGPDHAEVAEGLNNLAALYDTQGKYAEAEPLLRRALAIYEKALGPEHSYVAWYLTITLENYAGLQERVSNVAGQRIWSEQDISFVNIEAITPIPDVRHNAKVHLPLAVYQVVGRVPFNNSLLNGEIGHGKAPSRRTLRKVWPHPGADRWPRV